MVARNRMANPSPGQSLLPQPWRWVGERGLRLETGGATLARYVQLVSGNFEEIEDILPADGSILLILRRGAAVSAPLRAALAAPVEAAQAAAGASHTLRVAFGGEWGLDLEWCAARSGRSPAAFVQSLLGTEFTVAFLGFQPGFPYLSGLPAELAIPRRATPRTRVAAGSVALGGVYAGIYPAAGPGGWNVVGRTEVRLFDPARTSPALLAPGDRVRFVEADA